MSNTNDPSPNYLSPRRADDPLLPGMQTQASPIIEVNATPTSQPGKPGRSISIGQFLRYKWSILFVGILGAAVGAAGVWSAIVPSYTATATIQVTPVRTQLTGESDRIEFYETYRYSLADAMLDQTVLQRVIERPNVQATKWYQDAAHSRLDTLLDRFQLRSSAPAIDRLRQSLFPLAPPGKQLIRVSMTTKTPGEARLIVDAVTREFVAEQEQRSEDLELDTIKKLKLEISTREVRKNQLEDRAAGIRQRMGTGSPEGLVEQRLLRLDDLESRLLSLNARIAALSAAGSEARDEDGIGNTFRNDPRWQALNREHEEAKIALDSAPERFAAGHPIIRNLQKRVDLAGKRLSERVADLEQQGMPVDSGEVELLRYERDALAQRVEEEQVKFDATFADAEDLMSISGELETIIAPMLIKLRSRLEKLELNREVPGRIRAFNAYEPSQPTKDDRLKLSALAVCGSFVFAFGLAFVRLQLNNRVENLADVTPSTGEVVLGYLPLHTRRSEQMDLSPIHAESVRMVRTALLHQIHQHGSQVIQISSANSGAGKTTLAILLARSLAQVGHKVLLVDADIRRPAVARRLGIQVQPGLMDLLLTGAEPSDCLQRTAEPAFDVVVKGGDASNGSGQIEALANGRFKHQLQDWRDAYDVVLLDGPPMLGIADGAILARHADATVFVTRERHCRRDELEGAVNLLTSAGGRLLGMVFIGSDSMNKYGYAYGYGGTYGYGQSNSSASN